MDYFKNVSLSKNDENHLVLKINEDVKAGTLIDLNAITDIDTSFVGKLNTLIEEKKDEVYNEKINNLKKELNERFTRAKADVEQKAKENYESELKIQLLEKDSAKTKEISEIKSEYEKTISELKSNIDNYDANKKNEILELEKKYNDEINEKKSEIDRLNEKVFGMNTEKESEIAKINLKNLEDINKVKDEYEKRIKEKENQISKMDGEIEGLKNYRISLSTKGVGEDLEQWCYNEFNKHRSMGFMNDTFEKDNDIKNETNTKADFLYIGRDEFGEECVKIIFEMKNQTESDGKKHKNDEFLEKLNKDRENKINKGQDYEYAVLVSMLEPENEYYNVGIQDVSYVHPKMFVIRPQFLMQFISLIKNEAMRNAADRRALKEERDKNVDITNFEDKINKFKKAFTTHYKFANDRFDDAIKEIDSSINHLKNVKEELLLSKKHLTGSNNDLDSLTIKKLTYGNPTMQKMFKELPKIENEKESESDEE